MKKTFYTAPELEVISTVVEGGFGLSDDVTGGVGADGVGSEDGGLI